MRKLSQRFYIVLACVLLFGPFIAGPILFVTHHTAAGILSIVIPYGCIALIAAVRKYKRKREYYKIKDAQHRLSGQTTQRKPSCRDSSPL